MTPEGLRAALTGPRRDLGRFSAFFAPDGVALAPRVLADAPHRLTAATMLSATLCGVSGRAAMLRLATAMRQDLWRRLRAARGLAPVVVIARQDEGEVLRATVAAGWLDGHAAAPHTLDALSEIFQDGAIRRWTEWAARADR